MALSLVLTFTFFFLGLRILDDYQTNVVTVTKKLYSNIQESNIFGRNDAYVNLSQTQKYSLDNIDNLSIVSDYVNVVVMHSQSNKNEVVVNYDADVYKKISDTFFTVELKDKQIKLKLNTKDESNPSIGELKVIVSVPKSYQGKIDISNQYGNVQLDNLKLNNINAYTDGGDISIFGQEASIKGNFKTFSGKVNVSLYGRFEGDISTSSGEIAIDAKEFSGNISSVSSDISLRTPVLTKNSKISSNRGSIYLTLLNIPVDLSSEQGEVRVYNGRATSPEAEESSYSTVKTDSKTILNAKTQSGNIEFVNNKDSY